MRYVGIDILDRVTCVAKLTDTTFVSGSYHETLKLWNVDDGLIRTSKGYTRGLKWKNGSPYQRNEHIPFDVCIKDNGLGWF